MSVACTRRSPWPIGSRPGSSWPRSSAWASARSSDLGRAVLALLAQLEAERERRQPGLVGEGAALGEGGVEVIVLGGDVEQRGADVGREVLEEPPNGHTEDVDAHSGRPLRRWASWTTRENWRSCLRFSCGTSRSAADGGLVVERPPRVEPSLGQVAGGHRGQHRAAGLGVVAAVGEAAVGGQLVDVGEGHGHRLGVGGQTDGPDAGRVDQHAAGRAAAAARGWWWCGGPSSRPRARRPVTATSSPISAFIRLDFPAPDSPSIVTVRPSARVAQGVEADALLGRGDQHLDAGVGLGHPLGATSSTSSARTALVSTTTGVGARVPGQGRRPAGCGRSSPAGRARRPAAPGRRWPPWPGRCR